MITSRLSESIIAPQNFSDRDSRGAHRNWTPAAIQSGQDSKESDVTEDARRMDLRAT